MENFDLLWWFIVIDPPDCSSISTTWILTDLPSISMLLVAVSEYFLSVPPANKEETSTNMHVKHVIMPENPPKHCTFAQFSCSFGKSTIALPVGPGLLVNLKGGSDTEELK